MKHSAGFAILQGQSFLCRIIEISKLSKVDDLFTKHPGMWWTVLAPTERELSYETQHLTDAWKQKFADAGASSRCFCFESSLWLKMKKEERRIPKEKKACRIFLCIYWSSDSTADTLIPWSDLAIDNCHSSPPLMLSWQQPSESPKTPQISPASPNLATAPSITTRPKNLPSQSQQNSWWNNSWSKNIGCKTHFPLQMWGACQLHTMNKCIQWHSTAVSLGKTLYAFCDHILQNNLFLQGSLCHWRTQIWSCWFPRDFR